MARFLVTGGAGFIGSHLCDALSVANHQVLVLDNLSTGHVANLDKLPVELIKGDINNDKLVNELINNVDGCFHLAAVAPVELSHRQWLPCHLTNLTSTVKLFNAARQTHCPVVFASSSAIYGSNTALPLTETATALPISAYGVDKYACEMQAQIASQIFGLPTIGLRFFNIYGPRQDPTSQYSGVIAKFTDLISKEQSVTINGDGEQYRDFVYVSDAVTHLMKSMDLLLSKKITHDIINVCTNKRTTVNHLAEIIAELLGHRVDKQYAAASNGDIIASLGCNEHAKKTLAIDTSISIRDGLQLLLQGK